MWKVKIISKTDIIALQKTDSSTTHIRTWVI